jgi:hypothetical protein
MHLFRKAEALSRRKMHLFACACCRPFWHLLSDPHSRAALEAAERFADGLLTRKELAGVRQAAFAVAKEPGRDVAELTLRRAARAAANSALQNGLQAASMASRDAAHVAGDIARASAVVRPASDPWHAGIRAEERMQATLLRDIIGNPFRPMPVDPTWLSWSGGTVQHLAQTAYDERQLPSGHLDPGRLAVLADALEESGCADAVLLGHLRSSGPHVRGCFAVDALLRKS